MEQVIAVVGATGTGKSALAEALAVQLGGQIISADSMQVYKGMDIGTAKTPIDERKVPYHCIDLVDLGTPYTAALYQREARAVIDRLLPNGITPVLCGGTGLYIRATLDDFQLDEGHETVSQESQAPQCPPAKPVSSATPRERLTRQAQELGAEDFHAELARKDPASAALIHPHNVRRVVRAFELLEQGSSYAKQHEGFGRYEAVYPTRFLGISVDLEVLYEVIERRVDAMMSAGLLDEVRGLVAAGFEDALTAQQAIGYKELLPVLAGQRDLADAVALIKQGTRRYAKRQRTWFKRDDRIQWIDATDLHRLMLAGELTGEEFSRTLLKRATDLLPDLQQRAANPPAPDLLQ